MYNVIILGSGRSGTSMVTGTLAKAGYFMGNDLYQARESNPKGFFEDREINGINEELLAPVTPKRPPFIGRWFFRERPRHWQRWLARVPVGTPISATPGLINRIQKVTQTEPYCFKDPRFSYTLSVWRPFLKNVAFVCVFRNPASTARSILKECQAVPHLRQLSINFEQALELWKLMHSHILEIHRHQGAWLFLHYDQVVNGDGLNSLATFTGASLDYSFPEAALRRSVSRQTVPAKVEGIYQHLCRLADYRDDDIVQAGSG